MAGMAIWGIDLGQCALKAVKLVWDDKKDRPRLEAFDYIEHAKILSQPDADPDELIAAALEKFLSRNQIEDCKLHIAVPGQIGLAKFVKLPPVEAKKIAEIVSFEAKQQIPYDLEDVVWDWQKIGGSEEVEAGFMLETQVGIFAIKRDIMDRQLAPYVKKRIEVDVVQLSPVCTYNFAAYDILFHELQEAQNKEGKEDEEEEDEDEGDTLVLVDMGADKTDVVFTDGDSIYIRNLPIGGNHFTRALTKEMKLTFAKAEHLKRNAAKANDAKKLFQAMSSVFSDFATELQKSISYFASTHRSQTVRKVVGLGNGFKLPGLQKYLQKNLQYEVEKMETFNRLTGEEVNANTFKEHLASMTVAYGLALQGFKQGGLKDFAVQTNLIPREITIKRIIRAKKPWTLTAATALLLGFILTFIGQYRFLSSVNNKGFDDPTKQAKATADQFAAKKSEYDTQVNQFKSEGEKGKTIIGFTDFQQRLDWIKVMKIINDTIPPRESDLKQIEPTELDRDLSQVRELNIEFVGAMYYSDLSAWYSTATTNEQAKNEMAEADKTAGPSGEGWVFQILGYTHYLGNDGDIFEFPRSYLKKFQAEAMRNKGITHATFVNTSHNLEWTPLTTNKLDEWKLKIHPGNLAGPAQNKSRGNSRNSRPSFGTSGGGNETAGGSGGGENYNLEEAYEREKEKYPDFADAMDEQSGERDPRGLAGPNAGIGRFGAPGTNPNARGPAKTTGPTYQKLQRLDFDIQFAWVPKEEAPPAAPAAESAPSEPTP